MTQINQIYRLYHWIISCYRKLKWTNKTIVFNLLGIKSNLILNSGRVTQPGQISHKIDVSKHEEVENMSAQ